MKRIFSMILALLMVVGTMVVMPLTATAADTGAWDGKATKPAGTGREDDPYIIDSAGDLLWFSNQSSPRLLNTVGYDHKVYVAQYQSYYDDVVLGDANFNDLGDADNPGFEYINKTKYVDFTKPMVLLTGYKDDIVSVDMGKTWNYGDKIYVKQVCDIDMGGKSSTPVAKYWSYGNGTQWAKGSFFNGIYDGQGYTIKNGSFNQATNANTAWSCGMFGTLWGATVKNIVFENMTASSNSPTKASATMSGIGLIASRTLDTASMGTLSDAQVAAIGETNIMNIKAKETCSVISTDNADYGVGGILGRADGDTNVTSCVYLGKVNAALDDTRVGGIVGVLVPKNTEVTGCYFGGVISFIAKRNNVAVTEATKNNMGDVATQLQGETHLGGIIGNWAGTFTGNNKLSYNVNNGRLSSKTMVGDVEYPVRRAENKNNSGVWSYQNNYCHGGILGAASQLKQGTGATLEFKGNINLSTATMWEQGEGRRVSSMMGCYYTSEAVAKNIYYVVTMEDCHSVEAWGYTYNAETYPPTTTLKTPMRQSKALLESKCSVSAFKDIALKPAFLQTTALINNTYFDGMGTEEDPWKINNANDFRFMSIQVGASGGAQHVWHNPFEGKYFVQTADIDFAGGTISSMGVYLTNSFMESGVYNKKGTVFGGTYDGCGYAIKNVKLEDNINSFGGDNWGHGLFGCIYGATIRNLVLDNVSTVTNSNAGLLVGLAKAPIYDYVLGEKNAQGYDTCTTTPIKVNPEFNLIENIVVKDNCSMLSSEPSISNGNTDATRMAGIAAYTIGTTIRNCYSGASINWSGNMVGHAGYAGMVGVLNIGSVVDTCISNAKLTWDTGDGYNTNEFHCGGVVGIYGGLANSLTPAMQIKNCVNTGSFTLNGKKTGAAIIWGGIVGGVNSLGDSASVGTVIENCYNMGRVYFSDEYDRENTGLRLAGLVGCYWHKNGDVRDYILLKNCSTINMEEVNKCNYNGATNSYTHYNDRAVLDNGQKYVPSIQKVNDDGSMLDLFVNPSDDEAKLFADRTRAVGVAMAKARETLHYYGYQTRPGTNTNDIRFLFDLGDITINGILAKEIRFHVSVNGNTAKTVKVRTVYESFVDYTDGATTTLEPSAGMQYLAGLTIKNIPVSGTYEITISAELVGQDENRREVRVNRALDVYATISNGDIVAH